MCDGDMWWVRTSLARDNNNVATIVILIVMACRTYLP